MGSWIRLACDARLAQGDNWLLSSITQRAVLMHLWGSPTVEAAPLLPLAQSNRIDCVCCCACLQGCHLHWRERTLHEGKVLRSRLIRGFTLYLLWMINLFFLFIIPVFVLSWPMRRMCCDRHVTCLENRGLLSVLKRVEPSWLVLVLSKKGTCWSRYRCGAGLQHVGTWTERDEQRTRHTRGRESSAVHSAVPMS